MSVTVRWSWGMAYIEHAVMKEGMVVVGWYDQLVD